MIRATFFLILSLVLLPFAQLSAYADTLGAADPYAVLAGATVTSTGNTVITGSLGVSPGNTCTGIVGCSTGGPGTVSGTIDLGNAAAATAQSSLHSAYITLSGESGTAVGSTLSGTYTPGVYIVSAATPNLTGTIYLSDNGVAGSEFVFVFTSTLITASGSSINVNGLLPGDSVFWVVESSATLGNNTAFYGNILANTTITFDPGATDLCGRALGGAANITGAVTFAGQDPTSLTQNQVSIGCTGTLFGSNGLDDGGSTSTPEPATLPLLGYGLAGLVGIAWMTRAKAQTRPA